MALTKLIISIFILLSATHIYSAPIEQRFDTSTHPYEYTTDTAVVDHEDKINIKLTSDENPNDTSEIPDKQIFDRINSKESTTSDPFDYPDDVSLPSSTNDDLLFTSSEITSTSDIPSSDDTKNVHTENEDSFTTGESHTESNQTSIGSDNIDKEVEFTTTLKNDSFQNDNETVITANVDLPVAGTDSQVLVASPVVEHDSQASLSVPTDTQRSETPPIVQTDSDSSSSSSSAEAESDVSAPVENESDTPEVTDSGVSETEVSLVVESASEMPTVIDIEIDKAEQASLVDSSSKPSERFDDNQSEKQSTKVKDDKSAQSSEEKEQSITSTLTISGSSPSFVDEEESDK